MHKWTRAYKQEVVCNSLLQHAADLFATKNESIDTLCCICVELVRVIAASEMLAHLIAITSAMRDSVH